MVGIALVFVKLGVGFHCNSLNVCAAFEWDGISLERSFQLTFLFGIERNATVAVVLSRTWRFAWNESHDKHF